MRRPIRVLHAPTDVGGNAWYLSRAERALGVQSDVMVHRSHYFAFPADVDLRGDSRARIGFELARWRFALTQAPKYDVLHFNFGQSILGYPRIGAHHLDLWPLKRLGKKVVITYQGCDVRSYAYATSHYPTSACADCRLCNGVLDTRKRDAARKALRYVDHVYVLNPDLAAVVPGPSEFRAYTKLDLDAVRPLPDVPTGDVVRVVHAPTNREIKGTKYIQAACGDLAAEGLPLELVLIEGMSRERALEEYQRADLFVDQVLAGWYGGAAVEAMALGRPVISYLRTEDFGILPPGMAADIPVVNADPGTLKEVLRRLTLDVEERRRLGRAGRQYVEKWHDPRRVAHQTVSLYHRLLG